MSEPLPPPNIELLVAALARFDVDYVVVGGFAGILHGATRPTQDLDILARTGLENLTRLAAALNELDASHGRPPLDADDLRHQNTRWMTRAGRVDVLTGATGLDGGRIGYRDVAERLDTFVVGSLHIPVVALPDLIIMKTAANRPKDREALVELRQLAGIVPRPPRRQPPGPGAPRPPLR